MSELSKTPTMPYSSAIYNKIGNLEDAVRAFEAKKAKHPTLLNLFRQVFVEGNKNDAFGISLLHKHFSIFENQVLVETNNVTTPWRLSASTFDQLREKGYAEYEDSIIYPTSWMVVPAGPTNKTAKLMPFEFAFSPEGAIGLPKIMHNNPSAPEHTGFAQDFANMIRTLDLQDVVALTALPEVDIDGAIETTIGNKNILRLKGEHNVASPDHPAEGKHNIQASFFWPTKPDGTIPIKAKGASCEGWDTCKATVKDASGQKHDVYNTHKSNLGSRRLVDCS